MHRPQAKFHYLASLMASMGVALTMGAYRTEHKNAGGVSKVFRTLTGWRHQQYKGPSDDARIETAKVRRIHRGEKLQRDYDRCIANNPCLAPRENPHLTDEYRERLAAMGTA